ncbi:aromatic ring-hydroxylating oxygenase subunit alpha [Oharaeibacter diazotrophicus]|uniref:Rieske 2Fe-2S family protein n=1 Tax=Oharaeibacter diazotrophicus TaxID=1920512 RepID=A0A4R6RFP0_9HYPH|nr:aromatic ring-hydroxylating dioxygenase subunit alpha [Oharaeibacter diazotrophicus]TDP85221.1 Rieske 2Fe-2S family protein [Oharaeibacter diazotrophicus]BBE74191.1 anthranilate 1,2-dioxygenase large subunit [Pleomorphomonas sp. SM30]GLS76121.1 (Fe-S)-binding protein [Oharaeibacter diazotrophicus]
MLDTTSVSPRALLARRKPGFSLEQAFYTSQEIFDLDLEAIFFRTWIYVGVEPDVPDEGDVMVVDIGRASVLILRDDDGEIRAFHNVCRHRGARIVHDEKSSVGKLVCKYHAWTYDLDGKLLRAEHMGADFDTSCHGLKPVHLKSVEGLLFICLADEAPADIDDLAEKMGPYLKPHAIRDTKVAHQVDLIELGNWKITMENNRECYHCAGNHPELTIPLFEYGFGFSPESMDETKAKEAHRYECMVDDLHGEWEGSGFPSKEIDHLDDRVTGFRTQRLPIDRAGESQTLDTKVASTKLLGELTEAKMGGLSFWTQPNSWHHFMSDHIVTFSVIPLSPDRTLLRTKWLVHKDAVEGVDYDLKRLTEVWIATNDQDGTLVGYQHSGVKSPAYEPGPYSPYTEGLVEKFVNWYCLRLADHLG